MGDVDQVRAARPFVIGSDCEALTPLGRVSFICSSNNNIGRIGLMLNRVSEALGLPLPHPTLFDASTIQTPASLAALPASPARAPPTAPTLYSFPPPPSFTPASTDPLLRGLGFGYRAPFVQVTAELLTELASDGEIGRASCRERVS